MFLTSKEIQIGQIYYDSENIMKVNNVSKGYAYGYDIITEEFLMKLVSNLSPITNSVKKMITSERCKLLITQTLFEKRNDQAEFLDISSRTLQRMLKDHDLIDQDISDNVTNFYKNKKDVVE